MDAISTAYETGFANGYGTEPVDETAEYATLAETQSWEDGYSAGKQGREADDAHRVWLDAQGV